MRITFTDHAKWRKRGRRITREMIEKALKKPDYIGIGYLNRSLSYKKFPQGEIKVVYTIENGIHIIISVIWEKGGPYANKL